MMRPKYYNVEPMLCEALNNGYASRWSAMSPLSHFSSNNLCAHLLVFPKKDQNVSNEKTDGGS